MTWCDTDIAQLTQIFTPVSLLVSTQSYLGGRLVCY